MPSLATNGKSHSIPAPVARIIEFARQLRNHGIAVSPAEIVDSMRALESLPSVLRSRSTFSAMLASTMVKRAADLPVFERLFALWFDSPQSSSRPDHRHHEGSHRAQVTGIDLLPKLGLATDAGEARHEHGKRIDLRRYFGEGVARPEHDHHAEDRLRVTWMGSELHYDPAAARPPDGFDGDGSIALRRVATSGRPGGLRPPPAVEIPRAIVLDGLQELLDSAGELDPDEDFWRWLDEQAGTLRRSHIPKESELWPAAGPPELPDLRWDQVSAEEPARMQQAIRQLGAKLGGAPGHRRAGSRGRLDARRTMRRASSTGGVPFRPVFRRRQNDRPRLVVLCDASLSVRDAAKFLLSVSQAAQRQNGRVRTFVFVRDICEVTLTLEQRGFDESLREIFSGRLIDTSEASDGGSALGQLLADHGQMFNPKTTLLILGDARNNGHDPNLAVIAELKRRCRRVIWLTPEQRGTWRLAGCDLRRYEPYCDLVATVRTPADLQRMVNRLDL